MRSFNDTFGALSTAPKSGVVPAGSTAAKSDFVPAKVWLNFGYQVEETKEDSTTETTFIALKEGIALDTMTDLPVRGDSRMAFIQSARNNLRDQLLGEAETLKPGETRIICMGDNGLAVEMRRVQDAKAPIQASENHFAVKLKFAA